MAGPGLQNLVYTGFGFHLSADGNPEVKTGGVTIDWNTVAAAGAAGNTKDGTPYNAGEKFVQIGDVVCKITNPATDVVTIGGTPTGGTFALIVTAGGVTNTTTALAFNASAATVQAALVALANVGTGGVTASGSNGGPYTLTFNNSLGAVTVDADISLLTGGTPTKTITKNAPGGDVGMYGPYDPAATDGRQTLTAGECFVLNETWKQFGLVPGLGVGLSDFPQAIFGGRIYKARLRAIASGHSLANGPTYAELLAVLPRLQFVEA